MYIAIIFVSLLLMFNLIDIFELATNPILSLSPETESQTNPSNYYFFYTLIISITISLLIAYVIKLTIYKNKIY